MGWDVVGGVGGAAITFVRIVQGEFVQAAIIPLAGGITWLCGTQLETVNGISLEAISDLGGSILFSSIFTIPGGLIGHAVNLLGGETSLSAALGTVVGAVVSAKLFTQLAYAAGGAAGRAAAARSAGRFL